MPDREDPPTRSAGTSPLKLYPDDETIERLTEAAVYERRSLVLQAEVELRRAVGLPDAEPAWRSAVRRRGYRRRPVQPTERGAGR
jgi:hypothetical protein